MTWAKVPRARRSDSSSIEGGQAILEVASGGVELREPPAVEGVDFVGRAVGGGQGGQFEASAGAQEAGDGGYVEGYGRRAGGR